MKHIIIHKNNNTNLTPISLTLLHCGKLQYIYSAVKPSFNLRKWRSAKTMDVVFAVLQINAMSWISGFNLYQWLTIKQFNLITSEINRNMIHWIRRDYYSKIMHNFLLSCFSFWFFLPAMLCCIHFKLGWPNWLHVNTK